MTEGEIRVIIDQIKNLSWEMLQSLNKQDFQNMKHFAKCVRWNIEKIEDFADNEIT